jgi:O-Antigen ligase
MEAIRKIGSFLSDRKLGGKVSWIGVILWSISLPFAQVQETRFTSIFLFTILGGFLISCIRNGFSIFHVSYTQTVSCLPFAGMALIPLLHGITGEAVNEIVLKAPLFIIPWILLYQSNEWHSRSRWWAGAAFLFSYGLCTVYMLSFGPAEVYHFVRSDQEISPMFLISRPYYGLVTGIAFFIWVGLIDPRPTSGFRDFVFFLLVSIWMWVVLTKIALLALGLCYVVYVMIQNRKKPVFMGTAIALLFLSILVICYKIYHSKVIKEMNVLGGINYSTLPKVYSNSINNRLILWKASAAILMEGSHSITGYSPEELQLVLDQKVGEYNSYLTTRHLNPHNQFLSMLLKFGLAGFVLFVLFWGVRLKKSFSDSHPGLFAVWLFCFFCGFTEVYLDREMGIQLYIFLFFLSTLSQNKTFSDRGIPS